MVRTMIRQQLILLLVTPMLLAGLMTSASAQSVTMLQDDASVCAIFQALSPHAAPQCQVRTRSIVMQPATPRPVKYDATAARTEAAPAPAVAPSKPERVYAFATRIQFAYDSAQLAPEAYTILDNLAQVLKDGLMTEKTIQIEGHTDSAGSDAYNLRLSAQRALAVQRYLHTVHGIPLQRIPTIGKGEAELYTPDQPLDGMNRRVQFVNLTDSPAR